MTDRADGVEEVIVLLLTGDVEPRRPEIADLIRAYGDECFEAGVQATHDFLEKIGREDLVDEMREKP